MRRVWTPILLLTLVLAISLSSSGKAWAYLMSESKPLPQTIAKAKIILWVRLVKYLSDTNITKPEPMGSAMVGSKRVGLYMGESAIIMADTIKPPGQYYFQVIQILKGHSEPALNLYLPYDFSDYYGFVKPNIEPGSQALLLLDANAEGLLTPVDLTVPLIPLRNTNLKALSSNEIEGSVQSRVVSLMLTSLNDPTLRQANTYLLRNVIDAQIPAGVVAYLDDPNDKIRDNVLYCLATNQQVIVIPRIAKLASAMWLNGGGPQSIQALEGFRTPEAVPYLNPLILDSVYFTRLNAMFAVDNLANQTSIPYLMLALRDPDPQKIIPPSAYGLLHHLIPKLGQSQGSNYFYAHRDEEMRRLYNWWNDELEGKHSSKPIAKIAIPDTVLGLNPLLFSASLDTRQAAISKLETAANVTSIPYLVLALQDPDKSIAYDAYKTLHRLLPTLGVASDEETFVANRALESQPVYGWWHDELMGRHLQSDYWKKYWRDYPKATN